MNVPVPRLDDRDFEQLRHDAIAFVHQRNGAWDDLGDGDPGTILLEAFAYLTDVLLYRLNRVPDKARREFLALLGVRVAAPGAALTTLRFHRDGDPGGGAIVVPAGTTVRATGNTGRDAITFMTAEPVEIAAGATDATVRAHHCEQVIAELLGVSTGEPGQHFRLASAPVALPTGHELDLVIGVEATDQELEARPDALRFEDRAFALWPVVDSFVGLTGENRAVRVDRASGLVTFAPAIRVPSVDGGVDAHPTTLAAAPPAGRQIRAWYRVGGGSIGNVAADSLTTIVSPAMTGVSVSNPQRAAGGCDQETMEQALRRAPELFHEPRRAVTADDFEVLARREGGVARARAITEAEQWAHATAGTVEVRLVPSMVGVIATPGVDELRTGQLDALLERTAAAIARQQPLGVQSVVRWAQYKEVTVRLRVVVGRSEDAGAVKRRVEDRLRRTLSPTPAPGNDQGWPFGQALRASNVYNSVFSEPGVRYADNIVMELAECPDGDVGTLAADRFQPDTWYVSQGPTLFRSENGGIGWEAVHEFTGESIRRIVPSREQPGYVAVVTRSDDGRTSRLHVSKTCGSAWSGTPTVAFTWSSDQASQEIRDVCWMPVNDDDDVLLATDRGLYRVRFDEDVPRPWIVDPAAENEGCWTAVVAPIADGGVEVAVALQSRRGVWLAGPDLDQGFRQVGLANIDVRRLIVERRNIRTFLWAPAFAVGDDPGTGCHRAELRGGAGLPVEWVHYGVGWNGGICHDLAFLDDKVLAASEFNGVLVLESAAAGTAWRAPSVQSSGLPLQENRRFQPVRAIDAAGAVALAGTARSVFRTADGERFGDVARRRVDDIVTLPASWLFASGSHEVVVETEGE